jgi:hypothetical protein
VRVTAHSGDWTVADGQGEVLAETLPAGSAATTIHFGPYDRLREPLGFKAELSRMNAWAPTSDLDKYGSQPSPFDKLRAGSAGLNSGTLFCTRYSCVYVKSGERLLPKTPKTPN